VPVIPGRKTENEKFAGALRTYTIEALMSDGKALQAGTSHNLGEHFARVFDITYLDKDGTLKYVWQTSWGVSTRLIGAVIMVHGDDRGLALPPVIAPVQVVLVPIAPRQVRETVLQQARALLAGMREAGLRVEMDDREEYSPGWKFNEWEMKGVPLRVELGPRDLESGQAVLVRRDTGEKITSPLAGLAERAALLLEEIQANMLEKARRFREENTTRTDDYEEFKRVIEEKRGLIVSHWCGGSECEQAIKEETKATIRCLPFRQENTAGKCLRCGTGSGTVAYFARAY
jgi:prolyl-tRNA synthetase